MSIFNRIFCNHQWKTHAKNEMVSEIYHPNIFGEYKPTGIQKHYTKEVFICQHCDKIKIIKY